MSAPWGVVSTGFNRKTVDEILEGIQTAQLATISPILDIATESPLGQINGIIAREIADVWEACEATYHGFDPNAATETQLTLLAQLTGTQRNPATKSLVICSCDLDAGTYAAGDLIAHVDGNPDARFVNTEEVISPGGVVTGIDFEAEDTGPIAAPAGELNVIAEPVTGWNSVTNPADAVEGSDVESDAALRTRREVELSTAGSERVQAIRSAVSAVTGVRAVEVLENRTDTEDANGLPPHSFEVIVYDGVVPGADDDELAQAIWDEHPAGITPFGTGESGTALDDAGNNQVVEFTRVTIKTVWIKVQIEVTEAIYAGDAAVKTAVAAYADANLGVGDDVILSKFYIPVLALNGIEDVASITGGFTDLTLSSANVPIGLREIANIDTSTVLVETA